MNKHRLYLQKLLSPYIFLLVLGIVGYNCSSGDSKPVIEDVDIPQYSVNPDEAALQSMSSILNEVKYVQLHLPEETYLRETVKILFRDSSIYILEASSSGDNPKIFNFDHEGNFNYVIDKSGRGPGEFEYIYDFDVTDNAIVLSTPSKLMFYNKETGGFLNSLLNPKDTFVQIISMIDKNTLAISAMRTLSNQSKNLVKIFDIQSGESIIEAVPFKNHALKIGHTDRYFFSYEDSISVIPMYEQTVYRILQDSNTYSLRPAYKFDFGEYWIPEDFLASSYSKRDKFFSSSSDYVHTIEIFETKDVIYVTYKWKGNDYSFLYDKEQKKSLNIEGFSDNEIGWVGEPEEVYKNWVVNLVNPFEIEEADIQPDEGLREILNNTDDKEKPLLIFARFSIQ